MSELTDGPEPQDFTGRVAFVTGAATGIGLSTAKRFIERGCSVVLADMDRIDASDFGLPAGSERTLSIVCDVRFSESVDSAVEAALKRFGRIDILANVAGVYPAKPFLEVDEQYLDDIFAVNVKGVVRTCLAILPQMIKNKRGAIVNVSSGAARKALFGHTIYAASKAAVEAFTRTLALEAGPAVRANVVSPGVTGTAKVRQAMQSRWDTATIEAVIRDVPLGRIGDPKEVADAIIYLCSDQASFVTGQVLGVNGGSLMC
jgi:NAD(P)-dependent dehydrogenase (short-subunit alcohol dehydrogenase family)